MTSKVTHVLYFQREILTHLGCLMATQLKDHQLQPSTVQSRAEAERRRSNAGLFGV